jgi:hypothetical protein
MGLGLGPGRGQGARKSRAEAVMRLQDPPGPHAGARRREHGDLVRQKCGVPRRAWEAPRPATDPVGEPPQRPLELHQAPDGSKLPGALKLPDGV